MAELTKKCKRLWTKPGIRWLCGYFFVLLCGVGLVYYWRVAYSLGAGMPGFAAATTLIICGGFSAVYLLVFLAAHFFKQNLALKTAVLVFLAGLCFVFANPPMQAPDETMHFLRAYAVGSGQFLFDEKQQFQNDVNLLVRDFPGAYINGVSGEKLAPDDPTIADAFARYSADKAAGAVAPGAFTPVQQLVPYFPQALGVVGIGVGTLLMIAKKEVEDGKPHSKAWLVYAFLSAVFASLTSIFGKIGVENVESNLGTAIRTIVVLVMAWVMVFVTGEQKGIRSIGKKSWVFLFLSGITTGLSWLCYYRALQDGPASVVVPIDKLSILVTIAFSWIVLKEKLTPKAAVGLVLILAGTGAMLL